MQFKSFDRALFEANDKRARDAIKNYLGEECTDNPDIYGPDLMYKGKFIEVEVCKSWKGGAYPYPDASIPGRKGKWKELNIEFWRLSNDLSNVQITRGDQLDVKFLREIPNKYMREGEHFYRIPKELVLELDLKGDKDGETN